MFVETAAVQVLKVSFCPTCVYPLWSMAFGSWHCLAKLCCGSPLASTKTALGGHLPHSGSRSAYMLWLQAHSSCRLLSHSPHGCSCVWGRPEPLLCLQAGLSPAVSNCPVCLKLAMLGTAAMRQCLSGSVLASGELEQIMRAVALILSRLAENPNYSKFTSNSVSVGGGLALPSQRGTPREPGADAPALNGGAMLLPGLQVGPSDCSSMLPTAECGSMSRPGYTLLAQPSGQQATCCVKLGAVWPKVLLELHLLCSLVRIACRHLLCNFHFACLPPPASALQPSALGHPAAAYLPGILRTIYRLCVAVPCQWLHVCDVCRALGLLHQE